MSGCGGPIDALAIQYVREIAVVLRTRDLAQLKVFYRQWETIMDLPPMPADRQLEIDMHKMILELPALSDMHAASLAWLAERDEVWDVRENNCTRGCDLASCGRRDQA